MTLGAAVDLGYVPHVVLAIYLMFLLGIGVVGYFRGRQTEEDYYLAGRGQGLLVTVLTIMSTMFSSAAILGIPGIVYKDGAAFLLFALNLPVAGVSIYLLGSKMSRIGRRRNYVTPADMLADYYDGSTWVRMLAALVGALYVIPYIIMQIKAGGYLAQRMFPDAVPTQVFGMRMDMFDLGVNALSLITMVYVLVGGMRSVAWSDVLQGSLMLGGMMLGGIATLVAFGGVGGYFEAVSKLPVEALSVPGVTDGWTAFKLMTICIFGSVASMIQPAQWMRFYSAKSVNTLRRSAMIFSVVLPVGFLFGVMVVALGARASYPPTLEDGQVIPHALIGDEPQEVDQVVIAMFQEQLPPLLGESMGAVVISVLFVAIMAASMSTADSNLHALSAVFTRDVYDRHIRPQASEAERTWVGRLVIIVGTLLAVVLVHVGESASTFNPLKLIAGMMLLAIGFSCQLLPATLDALFIRRGTPAGAAWGITAGIFVVTLFLVDSPVVTDLERWIDIGCCGFIVNSAVFAAVSLFTRPVNRERQRAFVEDISPRGRGR